MINQNEYASEDIKIVLPNKATPVVGVTEIEYNYKKEHKNIKGLSSKTIAVGRGMEDSEGSITLLQSEVEGWIRTLPKGTNLTQVPPFIVIVAYAPAGGLATVDKLNACRISEMPKMMKAGDPNMEIKLPLIIGNIEYNI